MRMRREEEAWSSDHCDKEESSTQKTPVSAQDSGKGQGLQQGLSSLSPWWWKLRQRTRQVSFKQLCFQVLDWTELRQEERSQQWDILTMTGTAQVTWWSSLCDPCPCHSDFLSTAKGQGAHSQLPEGGWVNDPFLPRIQHLLSYPSFLPERFGGLRLPNNAYLSQGHWAEQALRRCLMNEWRLVSKQQLEPSSVTWLMADFLKAHLCVCTCVDKRKDKERERARRGQGEQIKPQ
jgi:hypothetical protein